ncbi:TPA: hypothetical protein CPT87_01190 [Candidatus Gastranaerophilales bacterium HUM_5]|nr:MAG TPA: hypothetical protein CPT99_07350 [Candidatus Gastranaerophilales bacterium HUM_4]DAA92952.1 MAG TPA: hypothetical protein CPT87_01190 [Candidatus Gastranaerophilales bacterium HUM_5]
MAKRRSNGEGCIYKDTRSGKWKGKFEIGYDAKGNRKFKSCTGNSEREVRLLLKDLMQKHHAGIDVSSKSIKVGEYFDKWFYNNVIYDLRESTSQSYEMIIRRHIKPFLGDIAFANLSSDDIKEFYRFLYDNGKLNGKGGLSSKTVENIHLVISSCINYALKKGELIRNPLLTVKLKREGKKEVEVFTREEQKKIINECPNHYYGMAIKFDFYTGLRAGELLGLTWDCVDFYKNTIRINKQVQRNKNFSRNAQTKTVLGFVYNTKTETSNRVIKVMQPLMNDLAKYKLRQDTIKRKLGQDYYAKLNLVFPRQDGYFTDTGTFLDAFSRIQNKLEIKHRNVHAMRHTFATRALESGMKPIVVSRLLGHASIQITMDIYGHVIPDFAEQELEKMEEIYV